MNFICTHDSSNDDDDDKCAKRSPGTCCRDAWNVFSMILQLMCLQMDHCVNSIVLENMTKTYHLCRHGTPSEVVMCMGNETGEIQRAIKDRQKFVKECSPKSKSLTGPKSGLHD